MTKKLLSIALVAASVFTMTATAFASVPETTIPVSPQEAMVLSARAGVTRAYEYEWRIATLSDGYVYRRLWNITLARWEGDWIKM